MAQIPTVELTDTFEYWVNRTNDGLNRLNQFAINESKLYANTVIANNVLKSLGNTVLGSSGKQTIVTGLLSANGRATIGTNLSVSGNTSIAGLKANNSLGTAGYILRTNGTAIYWDVLPPTTKYLEVANSKVTLANTNSFIKSQLANTNSFIKSQLANTNSYIATKADSANTAFKAKVQTFTAAQRSTITPLGVTSGNVAINFGITNDYSLILNGNINFDNPTNIVAGQKGSIIISNTASKTLSGFGPKWKRMGGTGTPSFTANTSRLEYHTISTTEIHYAYLEVS